MKRTTKTKTAVSGTLNAIDPKFQPVLDALAGDRRVTRWRSAASPLHRNRDLTREACWSDDPRNSVP